MLLRYILAWVPMIPIAIFNAAIRETTYGKYLGSLRSHQISTITGIILFGFYIWAIDKIWGFESSQQAIAIGAIWLVMTVIFEFVFGHYVMRHSWSHLLADYNVFAGRVWLFVLIWIAIAPLVLYRFFG